MLLFGRFFESMMARRTGIVPVLRQGKAIDGKCRRLRMCGVVGEIGVFRKNLLLEVVLKGAACD